LRARARLIAVGLGAGAVAILAGYWVALRPAPVTAVVAVEAAVPFRVAGPGTVQARIPVTLSARITATIVELRADQGDSVKRGQLLARLDDRELTAKRSAASESQETVRQNVAAAEAALAKARADLELARSKYRRDQVGHHGSVGWMVRRVGFQALAVAAVLAALAATA
jgi:multidrug efflux pump subunit AcrA (membrane-fusion protein)